MAPYKKLAAPWPQSSSAFPVYSTNPGNESGALKRPSHTPLRKAQIRTSQEGRHRAHKLKINPRMCATLLNSTITHKS